MARSASSSAGPRVTRRNFPTDQYVLVREKLIGLVREAAWCARPEVQFAGEAAERPEDFVLALRRSVLEMHARLLQASDMGRVSKGRLHEVFQAEVAGLCEPLGLPPVEAIGD